MLEGTPYGSRLTVRDSLIILCLAATSACFGTSKHNLLSGDANGGDAGTNLADQNALLGAPPSQMPDPSACVTPDTPGLRALRRLTNQQMANTIQAVASDPNAPSAANLPEGTVMGFSGDADFTTVSDTGAELLMNLGESLGAYAATHISAFAPCQTTDAACSKQVVDHMADLFFRAPIPADRLAAYEQAASDENDLASIVQFTAQAMVQSPYFVYRRELGDPAKGGGYTLNDFEIADEIAYQLTDGPPDAMLRADAVAGKLTAPAAVQAHVDRLLSQPAYLSHAADFVAHWLELDKILTAPAKGTDLGVTFDTNMRTAMYQASSQLVQEALTAKGSMSSMLQSDHTFVNSDLASLYGLPGGGGAAFTSTPITGTQRTGGLLFEGAFLASHANPERDSPVQRGVSILRRVLCQTVPPPPPGVPALTTDANGLTTRQLYEQDHASGTCKSCHDRMQGVGFLFEHFDTVGKYRDQDNNQPVDSSGVVTGTSAGSKTMSGTADLAPFLATAPETADCMSRFWVYATYGRSTWPQNGCTIDAVKKVAASGSMHDTLDALMTTPMMFRRVDPQ